MERAQKRNSAQASANGQEEVEIKDNVEIGEGDRNKNLESSFVALYTLCNIRKM